MTMLKRRSFEHKHVAAIAVCALGAVSSVRAADSGPFVALDLGWARYPQNYYTVVSSETEVSSTTALTNSTLNRDRLGWSISTGYQFNRYLNVEAAFVDLGSIAGPLTDSSGVTIANAQLQFSVKGETLAAVGMLPLGRWNLFVKSGVFFADTQLQVPRSDTSYQTQHALFGLGIDRHFAENWSTRVGFTDYLSVGQTSQIRGPNIKVLTAGLTYAF
jgi:OmpA-like transmembrane domain